MESVKKWPARKKADALVGVDRHGVVNPQATGL